MYSVMAANLYVTHNTEDNKSYLWYKQLKYDITTILQTWVNNYVNPVELGTNQKKILCLTCCWTKRN